MFVVSVISILVYGYSDVSSCIVCVFQHYAGVSILLKKLPPIYRQKGYLFCNAEKKNGREDVVRKKGGFGHQKEGTAMRWNAFANYVTFIWSPFIAFWDGMLTSYVIHLSSIGEFVMLITTSPSTRSLNTICVFSSRVAWMVRISGHHLSSMMMIRCESNCMNLKHDTPRNASMLHVLNHIRVELNVKLFNSVSHFIFHQRKKKINS